MYFLNNAQDFLFVSVPLSVACFVLMVFISRKVRCWTIPSLLAPFTSFSYLFESLFGNNIQYLCFRAFQQVRFIAPRSVMDGASIALAIVVLFCVIFCSCSLYLLIWSLDKKRFRIDHMIHRINSFKLVTLLLQGRALTGFIHAYVDSEKEQILLLLMASMLVLGVAIRYYFTFRKKRSIVVTICALSIKVLINVALNIEARIYFG